MNTTLTPSTTPAPDFAAIKTRQQAAWASGDYAVVGTTLQIVGEELCEALDVRSGQQVLDVAAGNGNVSLAAARRWCNVVATDYVPALLERARERAAAERLDIEFREADAEALPFPDESFDVVVSTFGVMFTPNQEQAAREMLRVCRSGGRIGLANWTPDGFIGQLFKTIGKGQCFRIRLPEFDGQPVRLRPFARALEQRGHVVGGDHLATAARGSERDVAVAGGDVQHPLARSDVERLAKLLADYLQCGSDEGIIARRPGRLLASLDRPEVGPDGGLAVLSERCCGCVHRFAPVGSAGCTPRNCRGICPDPTLPAAVTVRCESRPPT